MARDFTKNTANYLGLGIGGLAPILSGASKVSIHLLANVDTIDTGANDNALFSVVLGTASNVSGVTLRINGSGATKVLRALGRSISTDTAQIKDATSSFTTGAWHSCGAVFNFTGDVITPYFDGVAEGGGAVTFGSSTYTDAPSGRTVGDAIGAGFTVPTSTAIQVDGRIAEVALWLDDIGAAGFAALAKCASALLVRPDALEVYFPLVGRLSPERSMRSGLSGAITGTLAPAPHPRVLYPVRPHTIPVRAPVVAPSGQPPRSMHQFRMARMSR